MSVGGLWIPFRGTRTARRSIFSLYSTNYRQASYILSCLISNFCCYYLTSAANGAKKPGLLTKVSKNWLMSSGEFMTFCTVRRTKATWTADRNFLTPVWPTVGFSCTKLFTAPSVYTGMLPTVSRTMNCSLVTRRMRFQCLPVVLQERSDWQICGKKHRILVHLLFVKGLFLRIGPNLASLSIVRRKVTGSMEEGFGIFNLRNDCGASDLDIAVQHCWLINICR